MKTKIIALLLALLCVALLACDGNGNKNESDVISENESDIVSDNESDVVSENEASTNSDAVADQKVIVETDTHFNCNLEELSAHLESGCEMCKDLTNFMIPTFGTYEDKPTKGFGFVKDNKYQLRSIVEDENNKDSYIRLLVRVDASAPPEPMPTELHLKLYNDMKEICNNNKDNPDIVKKARVDYNESFGAYFEEHVMARFSSIGVSAKRIVSRVYEILITPAQIEIIMQKQIPMYMEAFPCPEGITSEYALEFMYRTYPVSI